MSLTDEQRRHLERRLLEERAQVARSLDRFSEDARESMQDEAGDLSLAPLHPADEGTDTIDQEIAASNATRETRELEEIDAALQRLYKTPEAYGRCEDTGADIPFERLDIIPWARACEDRDSSG